MSQLAFQLGPEPDVEDVSDAVLLKKKDFLSAICLCMDISGLLDDHIASVLEIQPAQFSKCRSGVGHFPPNKLMALMDVCKNDVPLRWLAIHRGKEVKPMVTTLEEENIELKKQNEKLEQRIETITDFVKETSR